MHNTCWNVSTVLGTFKRDGIGSINITEGNSKRGLKHILERHSPDEFVTHEKGDLFPSGTTHNQILDGINQVFSKGTRVSDPKKVMQTFEKRIKLNGESANYRLIVDTNNGDVVTFFKIGE